MSETFFTTPGYVVAGSWSEYDNMLEPIWKLAEVKQRWAKASPAEKQQITEFVRANTERKGGPYGAYGLVTVQNLDTGRKFLSAGLFLDNKGLTPNEIRGVVGLKPVKGGDKRKPLPEPKRVERLKPFASAKPAASLGKVLQATPRVLMSREDAVRKGLVKHPAVKVAKPAAKPPLPRRKGR